MIKEQLIPWIQNTVKDAYVIVGISGGKDSSVVACLCAQALGKDKVIGVLMPDGQQHDIDAAYKLVNFLGIKYYVINIKEITQASRKSIIENISPNLTYTLTSNLGSRIRMVTLYNVCAMYGNARVANTCNYSEDYVGYSTKYGDGAGDFSPLQNLLFHQVKELGYELGLPKDLIEKAPEDGLSGKTDEDNFGFTYAELDRYIETGQGDPKIIEKIEKMHKSSMHKILPMPKFELKK